MMSVRVRRARTDGERADALAVRRQVFVEEQGVPEDLEVDGNDPDAVHFVAYDDGEARDGDAGDDDGGGEPVGAARLREPDPGVGRVERVAVLSERRGEGIGRDMVAELEATAARQGIERLTLHAQTHVESFYHQLGYETTSGVFQEAGIDHVEMEKRL